MKKKDRRDYWVYAAGDLTITFPDEKNEQKKKAQNFNAIKDKKRGENNNGEKH